MQGVVLDSAIRRESVEVPVDVRAEQERRPRSGLAEKAPGEHVALASARTSPVTLESSRIDVGVPDAVRMQRVLDLADDVAWEALLAVRVEEGERDGGQRHFGNRPDPPAPPCDNKTEQIQLVTGSKITRGAVPSMPPCSESSPPFSLSVI